MAIGEKRIIIVSFIIVLALVALAGIMFYRSGTKVGTDINAPRATVGSTQVPNTIVSSSPSPKLIISPVPPKTDVSEKNYKKYSSKKYGYAFQYPNEWSLCLEILRDSMTVTITSTNKQGCNIFDTAEYYIRAGYTGKFLCADTDTNGNIVDSCDGFTQASLNKYVQKMIETGQGYSSLSVTTQKSGLGEGYLITGKKGADAYRMFVVRGGQNYYMITATKKLFTAKEIEIWDKIVSSFSASN